MEMIMSVSDLKQIGRVNTRFGHATIFVRRYPNGGALAVLLGFDDEPWDAPLAFSVNLRSYGAVHGEDEFCVKSWNENEPFVAPMLGTGLFVDTGRTVPFGYVRAPVWRLRDSSQLPPLQRSARIAMH
jgi:hypothetical protein